MKVQMGNVLGRLLLISGIVLLPRLAMAEQQKIQPYEVIRSLMLLQDDLVAGKQRAMALHASFMQKILNHFQNADNSAWTDPRNPQAALIYVLSGGDAAILAKLQKLGEAAAVDQHVLKVVLSISSGNHDEARDEIAKMDLLTLPRQIGALLALAAAQMWQKKDTDRAIAYYDQARLIGGSGLIEEAALRRQLLVVAKLRDFEKVESLIRQYCARMGSSVFSKNMAQQVGAAIVELNYEASPDRLPGLFAFVDTAPVGFRREVYLELARHAVALGQPKVGTLAAKMASGLPDLSVPETAAIKLLEIASSLATADPQQLMVELQSLPEKQLEGPDQQLLFALHRIIEKVTELPKMPAESKRPTRYRPTNRLKLRDEMAKPELDSISTRALKELDLATRAIRQVQ
jgi:chemotaxis protein MotC